MDEPEPDERPEEDREGPGPEGLLPPPHPRVGRKWADTPLGPRADWPAALAVAAGTCLASPEPMAIWWGPDLAVVYNEAYAEILGDRHPDVLGRTGDQVWPEIWDELEPTLRDVLEGGGAVRFEDEPFDLGPQGKRTTRWFTFTLSPIPDGRGGIGGVLNLVNETTAAVRALKKLEEGKVHTVKAQRLEAVSKLAGAVAHEFNNLLTVLEGRADVLLGALGEDSPLQEDVRAITTAGRRATALTDRLLAFGRQQVFRESTIRLDAVVFDWMDRLEQLVPDPIELRLDPPRESVPVRADPSQIERAVFELVANSIETLEGGTGVIELAVTRRRLSPEQVARIPWEVEPGDYGEMTLAHDGPGLSPEEIRHLFEPFVHSDPTEIAAGMGLAAVFGIVKQSRGHIFVESPPGGGRTVRILLPEVAVDETGDAPKDRNPEPPVHPARPGAILLVEDDDGVRHTARKVLEREGWRVLEAGDGNEALELISDDVALVVSDVRMPGLNGPGLCRELARSHPDIHLLLMSGYVDVREAMADLDVPLLRKPFTAQGLIQAVRAQLADR